MLILSMFLFFSLKKSLFLEDDDGVLIFSIQIFVFFFAYKECFLSGFIYRLYVYMESIEFGLSRI